MMIVLVVVKIGAMVVVGMVVEVMVVMVTLLLSGLLLYWLLSFPSIACLLALVFFLSGASSLIVLLSLLFFHHFFLSPTILLVSLFSFISSCPFIIAHLLYIRRLLPCCLVLSLLLRIFNHSSLFIFFLPFYHCPSSYLSPLPIFLALFYHCCFLSSAILLFFFFFLCLLSSLPSSLPFSPRGTACE